jgi:twitching motility two-component system response regulator PilH
MDGPRILVADDSATLLRIVTQVLSEAGYRVDTASDGVATVQRFYASRPDLVITDIAMPKLSGYLVCRLIKEDWTSAHVPVLMLTSRDGPSDRFWAHHSGAERYMTKDFGPDDLLAVVAELLAQRTAGFPGAGAEQFTESDILSRVCEMLDRKLYESTLVNSIGELGARLTNFTETTEAALEIVSRFIDYSLGCVALVDERVYGLRPIGTVSRGQVADMVRQMAEAVAGIAGAAPETPWPGALPAEAVAPGPERLVSFESGGVIVDADLAPLQTFVSMPMRSSGRVVALLGLASTRPNAFGEAELATLRLIEPPLAAVIDNARLYENIASVHGRM